ncbi:phasin family protein [Micromonospora marina]|uniref:phasin family protein n=1 Tax=Micromonospora marina TaxID=307120 RepID=UPI0034519633
MQDAWRAYLELAMGLTEAPRKKAQDAVMRVVGQGGATAAQLQTLAEELVATGLANRESLTKLVRFEVDRALGAVGLATADEVAELTRRVYDLERQLREARGHLGPGDTPSTGSSEPAAAPSGAAVAASGSATPRTEPSEVEPSKAAPSGAGQPSTGSSAADSASATTPTTAPATTPTKAVAKKTVAKKAIAKKPPATVARTPADGSPAAPARPAKKTTGRRAAGS